jgi:hypothetical protein
LRFQLLPSFPGTLGSKKRLFPCQKLGNRLSELCLNPVPVFHGRIGSSIALQIHPTPDPSATLSRLRSLANTPTNITMYKLTNQKSKRISLKHGGWHPDHLPSPPLQFALSLASQHSTFLPTPPDFGCSHSYRLRFWGFFLQWLILRSQSVQLLLWLLPWDDNPSRAEHHSIRPTETPFALFSLLP